MIVYGVKEIDLDIRSYLQKGAFRGCHRPAFYEELKTELVADNKTLQALASQDSFDCHCYFIEDLIDKNQSQPGTLVYDLSPIDRDYQQAYGNEAEKIKQDQGFFRGKYSIFKDYATNPGAGGTCFATKDNRHNTIITSLNTRTPLDARKIFYHEYGHALCYRLNLWKNHPITPALQNYSAEIKNRPQDENLRRRYDRCFTYHKMLKEVHADTFASFCLFLKNPDDAEKIVNIAASSFCNILRGKGDFHYAQFPVTSRIIKQLEKDKQQNKLQKYYTHDGQLDFKLIAKITGALTQKYAYSPQTYQNMLNFIKTQPQEKPQIPSNLDTKWCRDGLAARDYLRNHPEPASMAGKLSLFYIQLQTAQAPNQIRNLFAENKGKGFDKELKEYSALYNRRFPALRQTEQQLR